MSQWFLIAHQLRPELLYCCSELSVAEPSFQPITLLSLFALLTSQAKSPQCLKLALNSVTFASNAFLLYLLLNIKSYPAFGAHSKPHLPWTEVSVFSSDLFTPNSHHFQSHPMTGSQNLAWGVRKKYWEWVILKLAIHKSAGFHGPYSL